MRLKGAQTATRVGLGAVAAAIVLLSPAQATATGVPGPTNLQVDNVMSTSVALSWSELTQVSTPTGFRAEVDASSVTVTWEPSTSRSVIAIYSVVRDGRRHFTTEPTITFFLAQNRTYTMQVQAQDEEFRRSAWSEPFQFTTPDEFPVTTPGNLRAADAPGSATVQWDAASSAAGVLDYLVTLRGSVPASRRTTGTSISSDLPAGGDFTVTVQARDRAYRLSDIAGPIGFAVAPASGFEPPTAPTNLRATFDAGGEGQKLAWNGSEGTGPFTYHIQVEGSGEMDSTSQLELEVFGFFQCTPTSREQLVFFVTATANGLESAPSEPITLCFP